MHQAFGIHIAPVSMPTGAFTVTVGMFRLSEIRPIQKPKQTRRSTDVCGVPVFSDWVSPLGSHDFVVQHKRLL